MQFAERLKRFDADEGARRTATIALVALVALWSVFNFVWLRPELAVLDLQGWRQSDTQTIAENLTKPNASVFYPEIFWGGDGTGFVETEFQLFGYLAAALMRAFGPGEWAGQLVSSLAMFGATLALFFDLRRRHGLLLGALGVSVFLGTRSVTHLATSIQPDALSLFGYVLAWASFMRYRDEGKVAQLVPFALSLSVAMLTKPTAAQLGLTTGIIVLFTARDRLKSPALWLAWAFPVVLTFAYLRHAHHVAEVYGNSFGVVSGSESKVPTLSELTNPVLLSKVARLFIAWGLGFPGTLALIVLAVRRKLTVEIVALLVASLIVAIGPIRITSTLAGTHYVAPAALIGAEAVCLVWPELAGLGARLGTMWTKLALPALAVVIAVLIPLYTLRGRTLLAGIDPTAFDIYNTGLELKKLIQPGELVIVRGDLYDPRIFYVSQVRGWLHDRADAEPGATEQRIQRGARYFIDPVPSPTPTELDKWLGEHAHQVQPEGIGRIWKLDVVPAS
jgi:Dolichyl-phosphate-mannose-protein mannosyltransferase